MTFHAYLRLCTNGSYYAAHTDDLARRVAEHEGGQLPGYTHDKRPVTLVWSPEFGWSDEALEAERRNKGWSLAKKEALMARIGSGSVRSPAGRSLERLLRRAQRFLRMNVSPPHSFRRRG